MSVTERRAVEAHWHTDHSLLIGVQIDLQLHLRLPCRAAGRSRADICSPGLLATQPALLPLGDYASDGTRIIGIEPDIAQLLADALGLKLSLVPVAWADWPLGLEWGEYDAVISNVTVTEERKAKFDFSSYRFDLLGIYTRTDGPQGDHRARAGGRAEGRRRRSHQPGPDPASLGCGERQERLEACPVFRRQHDRPPGGHHRRADVSFEPNATGAYAARDGKVRRVGLFPGGWPQAAISVTTRKGSGLADALTQALNAQIENGRYAQALKRWDLTEEAVPRSETNPPGLANL